MSIQKITLKTAIFEAALRVYKSSLWHELKLEKLKELKSFKPENNKQTQEVNKRIKDTEKYFKDRILRSEKYNTEILELVEKHTTIEPIIDSSIDLYSEFTDILIDVINNNKKTKKVFIPALLELNKNGDIVIGKKKYILHATKQI